MIPKEKAKELTEKHYQFADGEENGIFYSSKQSALITANAIIDEYKIAIDVNMLYRSERCVYWQQVIDEINELPE